MTDEAVRTLKEEIKRLRKVIRELSPSLEGLLRKRGLRVYKKEPRDDLLLPDSSKINRYYRLLHKYSFRLFLRDVIKYQKGFTLQDVTRYATEEVTERYISILEGMGLVKKVSSKLTPSPSLTYSLTRSVKSFGSTLEWFMAEILKREFLMEATWGVSFKTSVSIPSHSGGDFDVIAKFNGSILYAEVKSSPPKQIYQKEIKAFLGRIQTLNPELSIFFMDTELRMKDKIVPMFEEELRGKLKIERVEKEIFHIGNRIFIMNSKDSIVHNLEIILNWYFRHNVLL